ncbi:hypothetical protein QSJ18_14125 [Gordonia sp. ABSL1-1]|uniref:hypothetical protein n=1 Tax=Gordonia sp. ABSL1-1 TaxID=3053923 RepID=UPI002573F2DA|nr:hypothetical protein [Gordonia sp. ABSL1-1]MDL9937887.1 hypothetical protein [Gordonia sp. ABSL1-1]
MTLLPSRLLTRRGAVLLGLLAIAVLAGVVAVTISAAHTARDDDAAADNRAELRQHAGRIVSEVFSVHRDRWQADRAHARSLVAPAFLDNYGAQLDRPPADGTVAVEWRPESVGLIAVGTDDGDVLMRVAVTTRTDRSSDPTTIRRSVRTHFVRADDTWLLDRAEVIG